MKRHIVVLAMAVTLIPSCTGYNKAQTGGVGGAAAGALIGQAIGRDTEATLLGAAIGGLLGYMVGNEMDKSDRTRLNQVYETSPSYQTSTWVNPDTGNEYSVTPQPAYRDQMGRDCREAEILAVIDGKAEKTKALACRQNSQWVIQ